MMTTLTSMRTAPIRVVTVGAWPNINNCSIYPDIIREHTSRVALNAAGHHLDPAQNKAEELKLEMAKSTIQPSIMPGLAANGDKDLVSDSGVYGNIQHRMLAEM